MRRLAPVLVLPALAVPLSQAGHALATALTERGAFIESGPAHRYFAADLQVSLLVLGGLLLGAAVVLGAAAVRAGGRLGYRRGWPIPLTFLALAAFQLEIYLFQELAEGSRAADLAGHGLAGQLPIALAAAVVVAWVSARWRRAVRVLARRPSIELVALACPPAAAPLLSQPQRHDAPRHRRTRPRAPPAALLPAAC